MVTIHRHFPYVLGVLGIVGFFSPLVEADEWASPLLTENSIPVNHRDESDKPPSLVSHVLELTDSSAPTRERTPLMDSIAQPDQPWLSIRAQNGDEGGGADPSDPTQVVFHVVTEFEWVKLRDQQGDNVAFKVSPFIPVNLGEEKLLFNFEVPIPQFSETRELGSHTGVGDTRLKLFWLIGTEDDFVRAIVPSIDAVAPTGNENDGTGGGAWVVMPNVVFALQPTETFSIYPFIRYVHSDGPRPAFTADNLLPGVPGVPDFITQSNQINGINIETMFVFGLVDAPVEWIGVTSDYFQNFSGNHGNTFTMKYDTGVALTEKLYLLGAVWHPVGGQITNDFTFKLMLDWYF